MKHEGCRDISPQTLLWLFWHDQMNRVFQRVKDIKLQTFDHMTLHKPDELVDGLGCPGSAVVTERNRCRLAGRDLRVCFEFDEILKYIA